MRKKKLILYFDDTGSRDPDHDTDALIARSDRMNCFGFGGILLKEEDIPYTVSLHSSFCIKWNIDYPLHSTCIRSSRGKFGWLKDNKDSASFYSDLQEFIMEIPFIGIGCIIHRPGYVKRYRNAYNDRLWLMCKTAFCILIERAAKFAKENDRCLEIFFEQSGKREDRNIIQYMKELKNTGNPFSIHTSNNYIPFTPEDYKEIVLGEPRKKPKTVPMLQIADLVLYPIAKGGYDETYLPYTLLKERSKLIDCLINSDDLLMRGVKYSCFDFK